MGLGLAMPLPFLTKSFLVFPGSVCKLGPRRGVGQSLSSEPPLLPLSCFSASGSAGVASKDARSANRCSTLALGSGWACALRRPTSPLSSSSRAAGRRSRTAPSATPTHWHLSPVASRMISPTSAAKNDGVDDVLGGLAKGALHCEAPERARLVHGESNCRR